MNSISYLANSMDNALRGQPHDPDLIIPRRSDFEVEREKDKRIYNNNELQASINNLGDKQFDGITSLPERDQINILKTLIHIILFVPNLLIVKPLLQLWYIITFPLTLMERTRLKNEKNNEITEEIQEVTSSSISQNGVKNQQSLAELSSLSSSTTIMELDEEIEDNSTRKSNSILVPIDHNDTLNDLKPSTSDELKSPTSPSSRTLIKSSRNFLTFPKFVFPQNLQKKTLILDLDETLVHSISRSSRSSKNGHMVEVKLTNQLATLYYVHKRPYCDFFLQKVSKWFDLVIFTASVKEYADPVIDWLESENKLFKKRYYRNHCTLRQGEGYIKDLVTVDKNLSKVIIIDNSPISFALHENNAILVEGWINDDSDSDLLNLLPLLDALRLTTDVRALLSLKNGEVAFEK
ncbi:hypothetical protein WICMUC_002339 [Wickerhamomyces mucosus]|uniref:FCP1 homology domain-containing protein n=1 Tax=Wickerhamomyces mucosus TaxID=1378264 RepID=A0A9P8PPS5_9ASCO|nr:hypothetical protein WICMUC_002339 [Wickerhamomyces mucosus]